MGLFGGNNIYKDSDKERARAKTRTPRPRDCTVCHGSGEKLNKVGRPVGGRCKSCKGSGGR